MMEPVCTGHGPSGAMGTDGARDSPGGPFCARGPSTHGGLGLVLLTVPVEGLDVP